MRKKIIPFLLCICFFISGQSWTVLADNAVEEKETDVKNGQEGAGEGFIPSGYSNLPDGYYIRWLDEKNTDSRTSFLGKLPDGGYQTVVYCGGKLYIENFDAGYRSRGTKVLEPELPAWGGAYLGKTYNYVICGSVSGAAEGSEAFRIVKYDKEFNRLGSFSLSRAEAGGGTLSGSVSIDESGDYLAVYMSKMALCLHTPDMTLVSKETGASSGLYVSASVRKIVRYDGGNPVYADAADNGEKYSFVVQYEGKRTVLAESGVSEEDLFAPGIELSGLAVSDTGYLIAGSCENQGMGNIFLFYVDKESHEARRQWLTDSSVFWAEYAHDPRIIKTADNRFAVMWGTNGASGHEINYIMVDGKGNSVSERKEKKQAVVTDCEPIFDGGKAIWVSIENGTTAFHEITDFSENGVYKPRETVKAANPWDGTADTGWYDEEKTEFDISTPQQLAGLSELSKNGKKFEGRTVNLLNDIFLNDESYQYEWTPILSFDGVFNGNGHTVYNMLTAEKTSGLFEEIGRQGIVKAVDISQGILGGGSIASDNRGIIAFCNNFSYVGAFHGREFYMGGICNWNRNLVYGCKNYGKVWNSGYESFCGVGGIVGYNYQEGQGGYYEKEPLAVISQCGNEGMVAGDRKAAGIAGYSNCWIQDCYNKGVVLGTEKSGGIWCEYLSSNIPHAVNCYSTGVFPGRGTIDAIGGIGCLNPQDAILNCYALTSKHNRGVAESISYEEMTDENFLKKLDKPRLSYGVVSAWKKDTDQRNGGLPITAADYNGARGRYGIPTELWLDSGREKIELAVGDEDFKLDSEYYYNCKNPGVTVKDGKIAAAYLSEDGFWYIKPLKKGTTEIVINERDMENGINASYQVELRVTDNGDETPDNPAPEQPFPPSGRIAGTSRYGTALACAEQMRSSSPYTTADGRFTAAVVACADNFPDTLAGSTLAASVHAPILLVGKNASGTGETLKYIRENVDIEGKLYLLGGTSAIPERVASSLASYGFKSENIITLAGSSRYETNLKIVDELAVPKGTDVVIVSGKTYADSLSISGIAGAKGMPIFLAAGTLSEEAVNRIEKIAPEHIYVIGGTAAVSEDAFAQAARLCASGSGGVTRIAGTSRYATSLAAAEYFGMDKASAAVFAYGGDFPDGLTGGAFAAGLNAPVILVSDGNYKEQEAFLQNSSIEHTYIMGGTAAISDETMRHLMK